MNLAVVQSGLLVKFSLLKLSILISISSMVMFIKFRNIENIHFYSVVFYFNIFSITPHTAIGKRQHSPESMMKSIPTVAPSKIMLFTPGAVSICARASYYAAVAVSSIHGTAAVRALCVNFNSTVCVYVKRSERRY